MTAVVLGVSGAMACAGETLRIMPLGDSITAGYTDNPAWNHPFEFGYRSGLHQRLLAAGYDFVFVGESPEPFDNRFGDPTHGGTVRPDPDLRAVGQGAHRGYGGAGIARLHRGIAEWIKKDRPDIILLQIGINGIGPDSTKQLDALVRTIFETDKTVKLIIARITPLRTFNRHLLDYNDYIAKNLVPAYAREGCAIGTVDMYTHFLVDPQDPASIDAARLSNGINHPTNALYDRMAETWFRGIVLMTGL